MEKEKSEVRDKRREKFLFADFTNWLTNHTQSIIQADCGCSIHKKRNCEYRKSIRMFARVNKWEKKKNETIIIIHIYCSSSSLQSSWAGILMEFFRVAAALIFHYYCIPFVAMKHNLCIHCLRRTEACCWQAITRVRFIQNRHRSHNYEEEIRTGTTQRNIWQNGIQSK